MDCRGQPQEQVQWVRPRVGHIISGLDNPGRSAQMRAQHRVPVAGTAIPLQMEKIRSAHGSDLPCVTQQCRVSSTAQASRVGGEIPSGFQLQSRPSPQEQLWSGEGTPRLLTQRARGAEPFHPAPPPLAAAPGAGRGCQMLGRWRRRQLRRARSHRTSKAGS